jgi:hypothetical protein
MSGFANGTCEIVLAGMVKEGAGLSEPLPWEAKALDGLELPRSTDSKKRNRRGEGSVVAKSWNSVSVNYVL